MSKQKTASDILAEAIFREWKKTDLSEKKKERRIQRKLNEKRRDKK